MIDIIIQGALYGDFTLQTANEYAKMSVVNKVIVSTWEDQKINHNDTLHIPPTILDKAVFTVFVKFCNSDVCC